MTKRTILVAHDLSPDSTSALNEAIRVARASGRRCGHGRACDRRADVMCARIKS